MKNFEGILEEEVVLIYLEKRNLLKQYKSAKAKLIAGFLSGLDFKERKPKGSEIFSFRINKQFRAICYERDSYLIVTEIDNHQ